MAVVEYYFEDIMDSTGLSKEKIIDGLTGLGAPCEERADKVIVELTPNRPDWFFLQGIMRSLNCYYKKTNYRYGAKKGNYKVIVDKSVKKIRPYTICAVVKNLKLNKHQIEYLIQAQEKLMITLGRKTKKFGMGFFDLKKLAFPINYTTRKPEDIVYRPLNYPNVANAREILERHPKGIENGYLIKNFEKYPLFIDAADKIMVLIPIVNSEDMGKIDSTTDSVFIEVTGVDQNIIREVLHLTVCSLIDMGGSAYAVEMDFPDNKFQSLGMEPKKMNLDYGFVHKLLGIDLDKKKIHELLKKMGYEIRGNEVLVPPYRLDIMHFVDIVEDIAIAYGFNNFEPSLPDFFSRGEIIHDRYSEADGIMRAMGFVEVKNFILTNKEKIAEIGKYEIKGIINPATMDYTALRPSLIISMLETFALNKMRTMPQKIYEIGEAYAENKLQKKFCFGITNENFSDFRGYLQTLFAELGKTFELKKDNDGVFDTEICGGIHVDNKKIGICGKVAPEKLKKFNLENDVYLAEISF